MERRALSRGMGVSHWSSTTTASTMDNKLKTAPLVDPKGIRAVHTAILSDTCASVTNKSWMLDMIAESTTLWTAQSAL